MPSMVVHPRLLTSTSGGGMVLVTLLAFVGCQKADDGGMMGPGTDQGDPRSYAMGWDPSAPRPDEDLVLAVIDSIARVSDVTIIQQPVPWPELLAGAEMDPLIDERVQVAQYMRLKGMDVIFLVDPLDGLDRRKEDPALVAAGRSILEPGIRALHEEWVKRVAAEVRPEWLGLASEINTLAARGDEELYGEIRDLVNTLAPQVRTLSPATRVFLSFQIDEANGVLVDPIIDHFELIDDYDIDGLGLSSYPVFAFDTPADIPDDYLDGFDQATNLPLLMVEGGWTSENVPWANGTPGEQVDFLERYEFLLDRAGAEAWVMLTFTDLDIPALGLSEERANGLSNFSRMGIVNIDLQRKPSYGVWERIFHRPFEN
jgi:hypothetical protein